MKYLILSVAITIVILFSVDTFAMAEPFNPPTEVPEPTPLALMGLGLLVIGFITKRKK